MFYLRLTLFTRIYNYTKHKHTPSSVLAKFRYFIEREGKTRRTVAVLGTVLRNSKWSDLSFTNINMLQYSFEINHYLHTLPVLIFITFLFGLSFNDLYLFELLGLYYVTSFLDNFNFFLPLFDVFTFLIPSAIIFITTLSSSWFFVLTPTNWYTNKFSTTYTRSNMNTRSFSFWDNLDTSNWEVLKNYSLNKNFNLESDFQLNAKDSDENDFLLEYYLYKVINLGTSTQRPILHEEPILYLYPRAYDILKPENTLSRFTPTLDSEPYLMNMPKRVDSNFYIPNFSYQTLNVWSNESELVNVSQNLMRQGNASNALRWAYRYNGLHRRSIINSHKLTEAKKLLSAGYFDSSSTQNNVWFSDQYARDLTFKKRTNTLNSLQQLRSNWNLLYRSTFGYKNLTGSFKAPLNSTSADIFTRLSFYESSFHFFLNRIKFYSSLSNHTINSNPYLLVGNLDNQKTFNDVEVLYNTAKNTSLTNIKAVSLNSVFTPLNGNTNISQDYSNHMRDLVVISKDRDIFNRRGAESIMNLTQSLNFKNSSYKKFSYNLENSQVTESKFLTQYRGARNTTSKSRPFKMYQSKK